MRKILLSLLAGTLIFGIWRSWASDETPQNVFKPVAVFSFTGLDTAKKDIACAVNLADNPKLDEQLEWWLNLFYQNMELVGFDGARPWGVVVQTDGKEFSGFAFLPLTNLAKLIKATEPIVGKAEDLGDGVYKFSHKNKPAFITEKNGWTFISSRRESLARIPADPTVLLDGLNKQYDAAIRVHVGNIPEEHSAKILREFKNKIAREASRRPGEPEQEFALRTKLSEYVLQYITRLTKEINDVTLGWKLDTENPKTYLEFSITAKEGTPTAQAIGSWSGLKSDFSGFRLPEAAFFSNCSGKMPPQKIEILDMILNLVHDKAIKNIEQKEKDQERAKMASQAVDKLIDLLRETVQSGRIDDGCAVLLKPNALTILAGAYVSNNGRLEEIAQTVAEQAKKAHPAIGEMIRLNVEEYQGVKLHTVSVPIAAMPNAKEREKLISLVGETLEIVIGTGPKSIYLACGRDAMKTLKKAMDQSLSSPPQDLPPVELSLSVEAIAQFMAVMGDNHQRQAAAAIADELKNSTSQDHLRFTAKPIPLGIQYRLEIQEGVLKSLAKLIEQHKPKRLARQATFSSPVPVIDAKNQQPASEKTLINSE